MQTITGNKSLITWDNSSNRNLVQDKNKNDWIKSKYIEFFTGLLEAFLSKKFCTDWLEYCSKYENIFLKSISFCNKEEINKDIWLKFRGNIAEIFVEKLFVEGLFSEFYKVGFYETPDNRNCEDFNDAKIMSSKDRIIEGLQIKNHAWPIELNVFIKAKAQYAEDLLNISSDEDKIKFMTLPRETIISFSDKSTALSMHTEFDKFVKFIGPKDIDKKLKNVGFDGVKLFINDIIEELKKL